MATPKTEFSDPPSPKTFPFRAYPVTVSIGLTADYSDVITPADEFTEAEWALLAPVDQQIWLENAAHEWGMNYVEISIDLQPRKS